MRRVVSGYVTSYLGEYPFKVTYGGNQSIVGTIVVSERPHEKNEISDRDARRRLMARLGSRVQERNHHEARRTK
jgi:hypothetical protein